jgi:hypothetical protein
MDAKAIGNASLSIKVIRADGTVEDRGMIYSTKRSDRIKMWIRKQLGV